MAEPTQGPRGPRPAAGPQSPWPRGEPLHVRRAVLRRGGATLLDHIDVTFEADRRYVILGPSGSGKSTLLRLLNRLEDPSEGSVLIGQTPLRSLPVGLVRRSVGLVFQSPRPLPGTVRDNLLYPWLVRGRQHPEEHNLLASLERVGLGSEAEVLGRDAAGLSGGERQRLALAVALQTEPEILALDEPTAALDPDAARNIAALLERLSRETALRTIAVCHQPDVAPLLGETAVVIDAGRVVDSGPIGPVLVRRRGVWVSEPAP